MCALSTGPLILGSIQYFIFPSRKFFSVLGGGMGGLAWGGGGVSQVNPPPPNG